MVKVATEYEINELVHEIVAEYKKKVSEKLSQYQPNQKIPRNKVTEILDKVYDSEIECYFFEVEDK